MVSKSLTLKRAFLFFKTVFIVNICSLSIELTQEVFYVYTSR
jgi:hypothetical protein